MCIVRNVIMTSKNAGPMIMLEGLPPIRLLDRQLSSPEFQATLEYVKDKEDRSRLRTFPHMGFCADKSRQSR